MVNPPHVCDWCLKNARHVIALKGRNVGIDCGCADDIVEIADVNRLRGLAA